ncbi:sensor domain-containing diguanylate cyclase [Vibrio cyclitrophicus]|uniref:sensor domain-containing diguanylate cyclase n=1 Tax=Vibrio cyclitrophicus TaxID=47951 RepID=UPI0002E74C5E|nr:sensor domain-containing diguanylate cyclase [Vibrio cyclitrophicus]ERM59239.1 Diguanylate cyclase/phosphodiesterase domain 2 [Vibrio cyclitrophicus FF75]OEE47727.1 diguanylate cyclase [Vibrio cyclitrophicus FF75]
MQTDLNIIAEFEKKIAGLEKENAELKRSNARLQEKLNAALDSNGLCLWEHHVPSGKLTIFNMDWGKMLGYQPYELTATFETWKNNLHPDDFQQAMKAFEDHLSGSSDLYEVVYRMTHKDGSDSYVYDRGRVVEFDSNGVPLRIMGTHIDITQEKRFEQQLAALASTDRLTGLLNRQAIEQRFREMKSADKLVRAAMIFIDIDNFKAVNDTLGHQKGDQLLSFIAQRLVTLASNAASLASGFASQVSGLAPQAPGFASPQASDLAKPSSELAQIGRIGGDEFVILFPETEPDQVTHFCEELLQTAVPESNRMLTDVAIGMSIGVCFFNQGEHHFDDVYQQSDLAMYQIKRNGKNGVKTLHI